MIKTRSAVLGVMLAALLVGTAETSRADLIGSTLQWQYYAFGGAYVSPSGFGSGGTFVVSGGIGGTFVQGDPTLDYFDIKADGASITFDYTNGQISDRWTASGLSLAPTIHNGIAIDMLSGPSMISVTIDPATNMVSFDDSRISFTSNQIQVDWQNLPFVAGQTIVKLDINTPEPSSIVLAALGLIALAAWGWRRRKR